MSLLLLYFSPNYFIPPIQFTDWPDKIIVCISDTHDLQPPPPNGDILIHSRDLAVSGTKHELDVLSWPESQPHPHKFFIGGNHDTVFTPEIHGYIMISSTYPSLAYLQESFAQVTIHTLLNTVPVCSNTPRCMHHGTLPMTSSHQNTNLPKCLVSHPSSH